MDRTDMADGQRVLTDEEWCELCFLIISVDGARERLAVALLNEDRPTLNQLWAAMSEYQFEADTLFSYMASRLRARAQLSQQAA